MNRGTACATYVPIPGLAWLIARASPLDRLVRHHARQAGLLTAILWALLVGLGLLIPVAKDAVALPLGIVLGLALLAFAVGVTSAARGRFVRLRPLWDLLAAFSGQSSRQSRSP